MASNAAHAVESLTERNIATSTTSIPAEDHIDARETTFFDLPQDVVTQIQEKDNLPSMMDLAQLRAVSREMRQIVAATGRPIYRKHGDRSDVWRAALNEDLPALKLMMPKTQRGKFFGLQKKKTPAQTFQKESRDLKSKICVHAARGGRQDVLLWLRAH